MSTLTNKGGGNISISEGLGSPGIIWCAVTGARYPRRTPASGLAQGVGAAEALPGTGTAPTIA